MNKLFVDSVSNRQVGRPKKVGYKKIKKCVTLDPKIAARLLTVGEGNLSKGIEVVAEFHQEGSINLVK